MRGGAEFAAKEIVEVRSGDAGETGEGGAGPRALGLLLDQAHGAVHGGMEADGLRLAAGEGAGDLEHERVHRETQGLHAPWAQQSELAHQSLEGGARLAGARTDLQVAGLKGGQHLAAEPAGDTREIHGGEKVVVVGLLAVGQGMADARRRDKETTRFEGVAAATGAPYGAALDLEIKLPDLVAVLGDAFVARGPLLAGHDELGHGGLGTGGDETGKQIGGTIKGHDKRIIRGI